MYIILDYVPASELGNIICTIYVPIFNHDNKHVELLQQNVYIILGLYLITKYFIYVTKNIEFIITLYKTSCQFSCQFLLKNKGEN